MKKIALVLALAGYVAATAHAQVLLSENFNAQTTGATVSGFTAVTPSTATPLPDGRGAVVVDDGLANKAMWIYDYDSANNARVEHDFGLLNNAHLSLSFRRNADIAVDTSTESTRGLYVTFGYAGLSQGSQANRVLEFRLFGNGQYRMNRGVHNPDGTLASTSITPAAAFEPAGSLFENHTLDIFVYSGLPGGATLGYVGPDSVSRLLDPNSFAVFIDNVFITPPSGATANGNFGIFQSTFYNAEDNLGRFGLVTGGASSLVGFDFIIDDITLAAIPEPSALALILFGGLLAAFRSKLRR